MKDISAAFLFPVPVRVLRHASGDEGCVGRAHVEAHQGRQVHHRRRQGHKCKGQSQGEEGQDAAPQPRLRILAVGG